MGEKRDERESNVFQGQAEVGEQQSGASALWPLCSLSPPSFFSPLLLFSSSHCTCADTLTPKILGNWKRHFNTTRTGWETLHGPLTLASLTLLSRLAHRYRLLLQICLVVCCLLFHFCVFFWFETVRICLHQFIYFLTFFAFFRFFTIILFFLSTFRTVL